LDPHNAGNFTTPLAETPRIANASKLEGTRGLLE
jgi:hypothetical protein